jgi:D-lactate dehydrogenase
VLAALRDEYEYDGLETCAADGSCALACPLAIDTGALVKELRARQHSRRAERAALRTARRWRTVERAARGGLRVGTAISRVTGLPRRLEAMPPPAPSLPTTRRGGAAGVYFPACINRIFGPSRDGERRGLAEALVAVSERAGLPLWIPHDVPGRCCATPWTSKGYRAGADWMANETVAAMWGWTGGGELPVVVDASSCTHGLVSAAGLSEENRERHSQLELLDSIEWGERLIPHLGISRRLRSAVVHPTCSVRHLGLARRLTALAGALADDVVVPARAACCGFAGDRGFLHPELTAAATEPEAQEVRARDCEAHLCSNRTCEIGLERSTGERFESFVYAIDELTR